jgi:dihydrofolate reductase
MHYHNEIRICSGLITNAIVRDDEDVGLRGRLPWESNRGREYVADVERFFELTRGHVFIMGHSTFTSAPYFAFKDRDIVEIHASDRPKDMTGALSEPRRLHRRRPARLCRLCAHPPLGHQPAAL